MSTPGSLASKNFQITLALLKPDFLFRYTPEEIYPTIKKNGLQIFASSRKIMTPKLANQFYKSHVGRFFYPRLISSIGTGPLQALILMGPDAVQVWRDMIGPTHIGKARAIPECLRAQYALSDTRNSFHGSDSVENALEEISVILPEYHRLKLDDYLGSKPAL